MKRHWIEWRERKKTQRIQRTRLSKYISLPQFDSTASPNHSPKAFSPSQAQLPAISTYTIRYAWLLHDTGGSSLAQWTTFVEFIPTSQIVLSEWFHWKAIYGKFYWTRCVQSVYARAHSMYGSTCKPDAKQAPQIYCCIVDIFNLTKFSPASHKDCLEYTSSGTWEHTLLLLLLSCVCVFDGIFYIVNV